MRYAKRLMYITLMDGKRSIYLHIPFCASKCLYCDFASYGGLEPVMEDYANAVLKEVAAKPAFKAHSLYIGGGTPSYLPPPLLERMVYAILKKYGIAREEEVTIEVNPNSAEPEVLRRYLSMGINRISIGIQSFNPAILKTLGRIHTPEEAERTVADARSAGFANISLDIMYGLPGETPEILKADLASAAGLGPTHISAYQLTLAEGTPLALMVEKGKVKMPDEDLLLEMTAQVEETLSAMGYDRYEISNYSRPGFECRHNLNYWLGGEFLGFGSAAHSFLDGKRFANIESPQAYITAIAENGEASSEIPTETKDKILDYLLMRFRLINNEIRYDELSSRLNVDFGKHYVVAINKLEKDGLLNTINSRALKLTKKGILFLDNVLIELSKV